LVEDLLALGRVLAAEPSVLLGDELSLGLAPIVVTRLLGALRDAADRGMGVLLVEQHARLALPIADRGYVLNNGEVVLEGTGSMLLSRMSEVEGTYLAEPTKSVRNA